MLDGLSSSHLPLLAASWLTSSRLRRAAVAPRPCLRQVVARSRRLSSRRCHTSVRRACLRLRSSLRPSPRRPHRPSCRTAPLCPPPPPSATSSRRCASARPARRSSRRSVASSRHRSAGPPNPQRPCLRGLHRAHCHLVYWWAVRSGSRLHTSSLHHSASAAARPIPTRGQRRSRRRCRRHSWRGARR